MIMKAITVNQPHAILIALNEKGFETRGWDTKYRGYLAIHAGKKIDYDACEHPRIKAILTKHGITDPSMLPTGCIIAITQLFDCAPMVESKESKYGLKVQGYKLSDQEYDFGYYDPGRFAWVLADIKRLREPIKAKGMQRLWNFDINKTEFKGQVWD